MRKLLSLLLVLALCLSFVACPAAAPDAGTTGTTAATGTTGGTKPEDKPTAPPLTLSADAEYTTAGKMVTFTANGGEGECVFSLSEESMLSAKTQKGDALTGRLAGEGTLTVTVTRGEESATCSVTVFPRGENSISLNDENIYYHGRMETPTASGADFRSVATGFEVRFFGTELKIKLRGAGCNYSVFIDGETDPEAKVINASADVENGFLTLAQFDEPGIHRVKLLKRSQEDLGINTLTNLTVTGGGLLAPETNYTLKMEVYGDSITCGHGAMRGNAGDATSIPFDSGLNTYAYLAATEIGAEYRAFAKSGLGLYTNPYSDTKWLKDIYGNVSRSCNTPYAAEAYVPDIIVINIGTNDCWAGSGSAGNTPYNVEDYKAAYIQFVKDLVARYEGHDIRFFLCSGMMENVLAAPLVAIAEALAAEGIDVHTVVLNRSATGHPVYDEHKTGAEILVNAIDEASAE